MRKCRRGLFLAAVLVFSATSLHAQQSPAGLTAQQQQHAAGLRFEPETADQTASRPNSSLVFGDDTYRWEGALIGFVTGALLFTYSGLFWCADAGSACGTEDTITGIMIGGTLFGFPGLLIGGLFPKHPPVREQEGGGVE